MPLTYRVFKDPFPVNPREAYTHAGSIWLWQAVPGLSHEVVVFPDFLKGTQEGIQKKRYHTLPIFYSRGTNLLSVRSEERAELVGLIYISQETAKEYWPDFEEREVKDVLRQEIEELEMFLQGDVWAYEVKDGDEVAASFFGIYGAGEVVAQALDCVEALERMAKEE